MAGLLKFDSIQFHTDDDLFERIREVMLSEQAKQDMNKRTILDLEH